MTTIATHKTENVMLLTEYKNAASKVAFPALVQQKIDGYRCVYIDGKFYSRQGIEFTHPSLAPIAEALLSVPTGIAIDGELQHTDGTYSSTGRIFGANEDDSFVFHAFDSFEYSDQRSYQVRYAALRGMISKSERLKVVESVTVSSHDEIRSALIHALYAGKEGIVIKNIAGKYTFGRSTDAQKLKTV